MDRRQFLRACLGGTASIIAAPYIPKKTFSFLGNIFRANPWQQEFMNLETQRLGLYMSGPGGIIDFPDSMSRYLWKQANFALNYGITVKKFSILHESNDFS